MTVTSESLGRNFRRISATAVSANGLNSGDAIAVSDTTRGTFQVVHATHDDTSTWEIQSSVDGTNYDTVTGTSTTTAGASGSASLIFDNIPGAFIRLTVTEADGNAASTLIVHFIAKKDR
jgi:subtilisin family serine protease